MKEKEKLKQKIYEAIETTIDTLDKVGKINYFEINIKHTNGELVIKPSYTEKEKI